MEKDSRKGHNSLNLSKEATELQLEEWEECGQVKGTTYYLKVYGLGTSASKSTRVVRDTQWTLP